MYTYGWARVVHTCSIFTIVERISMKYYVRYEMQLLLLPFITLATVALNKTKKNKKKLAYYM